MTDPGAVASFRAVNRPTVLLAAVAVSLAACAGGEERAQPPRPAPPVLAGVPVFPFSVILDTTATEEAARATLIVAQIPDSVAAFYRRRLTAEGWRILSDMAADSGVTIYAQRQGPPLWIQIRPGRRPRTTVYSLIGAANAPAPSGDTAR